MSRKIPMAALLLLAAAVLLFSGCGVSGAVAKQAQLVKEADDAVVLADAATIAGSINVYNAMLDTGSADTITSIVSVEDLKKKLGSLWPDKMTDDQAKKAVALLSITDGIATVKTETAQHAS